jgi:hypothetical protein
LREPIPAATISGQVLNGTTNEAVTSGTVLLRAFTASLEEQLSLTAAVDSNGRYTFTLNDVPPDWIFLATLLYQNVSFSSGANQLDRTAPELELPITVYELTTDDSDIAIEQLQFLLEFLDGRLLVSELYRFSNQGTAVYVGAEANPALGTVELVLPAGAENIAFQRSLGGLESFLPANDVVQTDTGWADVVPVRPGRGSLNLLVRYELPFQPGTAIIAHPFLYDLNAASVVLPDSGVTVSGAGWTRQGEQENERGRYVTYVAPGLPAGTAIQLTLEGRPNQVFNADGNLVLARNQPLELAVGVLVLLGTVAGGLVLLRRWQGPDTGDTIVAASNEVEGLLLAAAELDEAYEQGEIDDQIYQQQRATIKERLIALWSR